MQRQRQLQVPRKRPRPPAHTVILRRLKAIDRDLKTTDRRVKKRSLPRSSSLAEIFRAMPPEEMVQMHDSKKESIVLLYVLVGMHLPERELPAILDELRRCSHETISSLPFYKRLIKRLAQEVAQAKQTTQAA
ncbi:MAG: hypothetical protein Q7T01_02035 [bacterium]|nr:hypothetical protein [bacterium]